ncbi:Lin0512 family protein [Azospirillum sp. sgz302134]
MKQVMFVELGMGADLHGQDVTKAAIRAVRNAIERNSMPGMRTLVNGDTSKMRVHVRLAVPADADRLDQEAVRAVFPYGQVTIEVMPGGMLAPSGIFLADKADRNEMIYIVNAAVEVGI